MQGSWQRNLVAEGIESNPWSKTFKQMVDGVKQLYDWNDGLQSAVDALGKEATDQDDLFPNIDTVIALLATDAESTRVHPKLKGQLRENLLKCAQESVPSSLVWKRDLVAEEIEPNPGPRTFDEYVEAVKEIDGIPKSMVLCSVLLIVCLRQLAS
jgi:hypothetical protein